VSARPGARSPARDRGSSPARRDASRLPRQYRQKHRRGSRYTRLLRQPFSGLLLGIRVLHARNRKVCDCHNVFTCCLAVAEPFVFGALSPGFPSLIAYCHRARLTSGLCLQHYCKDGVQGPCLCAETAGSKYNCVGDAFAGMAAGIARPPWCCGGRNVLRFVISTRRCAVPAARRYADARSGTLGRGPRMVRFVVAYQLHVVRVSKKFNTRGAGEFSAHPERALNGSFRICFTPGWQVLSQWPSPWADVRAARRPTIN